jgi:hypothetical protein
MQVFLRQMVSAATCGLPPNWSDASASIRNAVHTALRGQVLPEEAMLLLPRRQERCSGANPDSEDPSQEHNRCFPRNSDKKETARWSLSQSTQTVCPAIRSLN